MSAEKVIEGMRQAVASARCDHDLEALPHQRIAHDPECVVIRERCRKCLTYFSHYLYNIPLPGR